MSRGQQSRFLNRYVRRLRRRAYTLLGIRSLISAAGAGSATFAVASALVEVGASTAALLVSWSLVLGASVLAGLGSVRMLGPLRRHAPSRLLARAEPQLGSATRSALELARQPGHGSPALVAAHATRVVSQLQALPIKRVAPLSWLTQPAVLLSGAGGALAVGLLLLVTPLQAGALTLLGPAGLSRGELPAAPLLTHLHAKLVYPKYLARAATTLENATRIEAPPGTTVELRGESRVEASAATLRVGEESLRMTLGPGRSLAGRFVVRHNAPLSVRVQRGERWLEDDSERRVVAVPDTAPIVELQSPRDGVMVALDTPLPLRAHVQDDGGVVRLELVVRRADGTTQRRRMWSQARGAPELVVRAKDSMRPREFGAQPGESLLLWLEARDGDVVRGPHVGLSNTVTVEIASAASRRSLQIQSLDRIAALVLDTLAARLERPLERDRSQARERFKILQRDTRAWLTALASTLDTLEEQPVSGVRTQRLSDLHRRHRRLLREERKLYLEPRTTHARLKRADDKGIAALETDALLLADLVAQARLEDAGELAQDLAEAKERLRKLLEEYKNARTPSAQRAALHELARLQRQLRRLAAQLQQMTRQVPGEFMNPEALPKRQAFDSLSKLQKALEAGELDAALKSFEALAEQIEQLAASVQAGDGAFAEARFGPQDRALAQALDRLSMLAAEQGRLAQRSAATMRDALNRVERSAKAEHAGKRLQKRLRSIRDKMDQLERDALSLFEKRVLERLERRLSDTGEALKAGDLGEARRMAGEASSDLRELDQNLRIESQMFGGHHGETMRNARRAQQAHEHMRRMQRKLAELTPRASDLLREDERRKVRGDAQAQRKLTEAAQQLADRFQQGPDGMAVSEQAAESLGEAQQAMSRARQMLGRADLDQALQAQRQAENSLQRLRQRFAENSRRSPNGSRGSGSGSGTSYHGPVRIPGAEEGAGPAALRRKVLDAMKESAPKGYRSALARYYEELLR